jgi:hypothetical protein
MLVLATAARSSTRRGFEKFSFSQATVLAVRLLCSARQERVQNDLSDVSANRR